MAHPQPSRKHSACLSRVSRKQCNCRREKVGQPPLPGCRKLCHGRSAAASRSLCLLGRPLRMRLGEHMLIRRRISYAALPFFWRLEPADSVILLQPVRRHKRVSGPDRKSTRLNSSHSSISYAVFCLKKKKKKKIKILLQIKKKKVRYK